MPIGSLALVLLAVLVGYACVRFQRIGVTVLFREPVSRADSVSVFWFAWLAWVVGFIAVSAGVVHAIGMVYADLGERFFVPSSRDWSVVPVGAIAVRILVMLHVANDEHRFAQSVQLAKNPPAHLAASWWRCWGGVGARDEADGNRLLGALILAWDEPQRRYHTLQHLEECLATLEPHLDRADHPAEVELAIWFHDAVYWPYEKDNEELSADWAEGEMEHAGIAPERIERVKQHILATRHAAEPVGVDQQLVVDVDLSILGAPRERFEAYERQVRAEYSRVPTVVFRRKRREILREFLAREPLYGTPAIRDALEPRARDNLAWSLRQLGG